MTTAARESTRKFCNKGKYDNVINNLDKDISFLQKDISNNNEDSCN